MSTGINAIECLGLSKYYGRARGIEDIEFSVAEGELFGFIGPNGAGKSTTIRTLLGLIRASGGEARLFGHAVGLHTPELHLDVGYVPAEVSYYPEMRVRDLLAYSAGFYARPCDERMKQLAKAFTLELDKRIGALSLGNKKKVALVQALQHRPRLLILDEPSSGLDPLMQRQLYAVLEEEHATGTTIFFSSHVLGEVQRLCKRIAIIRDGRLLAVQAVDALRSSQLKRVQVRLRDGAVFDSPLRLDGISDIERSDDGSLRFLYAGEVRPLLRMLADLDAQDISIEEPGLEEVVLRYYDNATSGKPGIVSKARRGEPSEEDISDGR